MTEQPISTYYLTAGGWKRPGTGGTVTTVDTTPPSAPTGVTATTSGQNVALAWTAANDAVGVTGYEIHRSTISGFIPGTSTLLIMVTGVSYTDSSVPAGTYYYKIIANDAAGNKSAASTQVSAVVQPPAVADTTAPTVPTNVVAAVSGTTATLTWTASTDDTGVTGYEVYRSTTSGFTPSATSLIGTASTTSFTNTGVAGGTHYYRVLAKDAAGNKSAASPEVSAVVATSTSSTPWLPFDMPNLNSATYRGWNTVQVWPHLFIPYPRSISNPPAGTLDYDEKYFRPPGGVEGNGTNHPSWGGSHRNYTKRRPQLVDGAGVKLTEPLHMKADYKSMFKWMIDSGFDGFMSEMLSTRTAQLGLRIGYAIQALGEMHAAGTAPTWFRHVMMPDGTTGMTHRGVATLTVTEANACADDLTAYINMAPNSVQRDDSGKAILCPFDPEQATIGGSAYTYWKAVVDRCAANGTPVSFIGCYVSTWTSTGQAPNLNPLAIGHGRWGDRDPATVRNTSSSNKGAAKYCHDTYKNADGSPKIWLHWAFSQDARPNPNNASNNGHGRYWESYGFEGLRASWEAILQDAPAGSTLPSSYYRPDKVQVPTWDDWNESAGIAPSASAGWTWCDLFSYYIAWLKTGTKPTIVRDCIYLAHRRHLTSVGTSSAGQTVFVTGSGNTNIGEASGGTTAKNEVEAWCFIAGDAECRMYNGSTLVKTQALVGRGDFVVRTPLQTGVWTIELWRGTTKVATVSTRTGSTAFGGYTDDPNHTVTSTPYVQDMEYKTRSSLRQARGEW